MTAAMRDRVLRWSFPTLSAALAFMAALLTLGRNDGIAEAKADAVAIQVRILSDERKQDRELLARIDENVKALKESRATDMAILNEMRALRADIERIRTGK